MTESSGGGNSLMCPVCRKRFEKRDIRLASDVERAMASEIVKCVDCHDEVSNCPSINIVMIASFVGAPHYVHYSHESL